MTTIEPAADKAQEIRAAIETAWKGAPLSLETPSGHTLILDQVPALATNKRSEVVGVECDVRLFDPAGKQLRYDGHRYVVNPPLLVIDPLGKPTLHEIIVGGERRQWTRPAYKRDAKAALVEVLLQTLLQAPNERNFDRRATTTTVFSATGDGIILSSNNTYATAQSGSNLTASADDGLFVGQYKSGAPYTIYQGFQRFDTSSIPDGDIVSAAVLSLYGAEADASATDFNVEVRLFDFSSGGLTTADWRTLAQYNALTLLATFATSGYNTSGYNAFTESGGAFANAINKTGTTYLIMASSRFSSSNAPTGDEYVGFFDPSEAGTTTDPKLVITHAAPAGQLLNGGKLLNRGILGGRLVGR